MFTFGDGVVIALVLLIIGATAWWTWTGGAAQEETRRVYVMVNNRAVANWTFEKARVDSVVGTMGTAVFITDRHSVRLVSAPCTAKLCLSISPLKDVGDVSVCVPNGLVVGIVGTKKTILDAVTQ